MLPADKNQAPGATGSVQHGLPVKHVAHQSSASAEQSATQPDLHPALCCSVALLCAILCSACLQSFVLLRSAAQQAYVAMR